MGDVIDALLEHVRCNGMELRYLREAPEYIGLPDQVEGALDNLRAALSPEQKDLLECYLDAALDMESMDGEALFRCGLSVGLTLGTMA